MGFNSGTSPFGFGSSQGTGTTGDPKMKLYLQNFEGNTDLAYPLGVFSTTGAYLGIANTADEYRALWNADANNQELGTITAGSGTEFDFVPIYINILVNLYALEYFTVSGWTNLRLHLDDDNIVAYGTTVKKAVDSPLVLSDTENEWKSTGVNRFFTPSFYFRKVTCTGAANGQLIYVFHNRQSKCVGGEYSDGQYTIGGVLPSALKYFAFTGQGTTDYRNVANWAALNKLEFFHLQHNGGGVWYLDPANLPSLNQTSLRGVLVGDVSKGAGSAVAAVPELIAWFNTFTAQLQQLEIHFNGYSAADSPAIFDAIPRVTTQLAVTSNGANGTSANIDSSLIKIQARLNGIVPTAPALIYLKGFNGRTAASDVAVNALTAAGWTVQAIA